MAEYLPSMHRALGFTASIVTKKKSMLRRKKKFCIHWCHPYKFQYTHSSGVFRNVYVYANTCVHVVAIYEKRSSSIEGDREECMGGFGRGIRREKCCN